MTFRSKAMTRLWGKKGIQIGAAVLAAVGIGAAVCFGALCPTSARRPENQYQQPVQAVVSSVDADADGIDDQTDLLNGALAYIATRPRYRSEYYTTGYPNDRYGVCTDVVAQACLAAGYDLMQLVQDDIADHPEDYAITTPDPNIDFRRVRNLAVYLEHRAVPLTTDLCDIQAWQGGDIVVFEKHIGIVSDRRNRNGVPYVIHHNGRFQARYEEDILEKRTDLVGHYRISQ